MADPFPPDQMTLDELRDVLAPHIAANAVFDGWNAPALAAAADQLNVPRERARLCFPGGAAEMIATWFAHVDRVLAERLSGSELAAMKIRDRIRALVLGRLEIMKPHREAVRRARSTLALPTNIPKALKLGWQAADTMWHLAGDTATDFNHYSKRATLAAVYTSTLTVWLQDEEDGIAATKAFLDRRIEDVMRFERAKARLSSSSVRHFSVPRLLGRLRYPEF